MVLKPSELAPLSAIIIAELIDEAGFQGVFNLVNGDGATTGDALTSHPDVNMISFWINKSWCINISKRCKRL